MNYIDIEYDNNELELRAPQDLVLGNLQKILEALEQDEVELSCSFVTDEHMQALNLQYRDKDEPTDILSFVQADSIADDDFAWPVVELEEDVVEEEPVMLGDMVISMDSLKRNADYFSVSEQEELNRLLVHGVLHLVGHDHATNDAAEPMLQIQEQMLKQLWG